jgi:protein SCO1/2
VLYQRVDTEDSALGYTLDHSATTYLIGPQGKVRDLVRHRVEAQEMVEAVRTVLAG